MIMTIVGYSDPVKKVLQPQVLTLYQRQGGFKTRDERRCHDSTRFTKIPHSFRILLFTPKQIAAPHVSHCIAPGQWRTRNQRHR
jgi:hypothetical protein